MGRDPIPQIPNSSNYGNIIQIYDFSKGLCTVKPKVLLQLGFTPEQSNTWYDENYALEKMPGTSLLLLEDNDFADNPIYQLYNFTTILGREYLIIQAEDSGTMKIWTYENTADDVTAIKTSGLSGSITCNFASYLGRLYMTNGVNPLQYWYGAGVNWKEYHIKYPERFKYINPHQSRLFLANSSRNPRRLIYTNPLYCHFAHYYINKYNYIDIPIEDGSEITHIVSWNDSLLVFLDNHIYQIFGDLLAGTPGDELLRVIANGIGAIPNTPKVFNDNVIFASRDGIYVLTSRGLFVSQEDMQVKSKSPAIRVSSEIDDWWRENIYVPDKKFVREKVWVGSDLSTMSLSSCGYHTDSVNTENPGVINPTLTGGRVALATQDTSDSWVALTHLASSDVTEAWYAEQCTIGAESVTYFPSKVRLYIKKAGTLTSSMKLNVLITETKDVAGSNEPDLDYPISTGQYVLNKLETRRVLYFDTGSGEITVGQTVTGGTGGATGVVAEISLDSGTWADGDAAGVMWITGQTGAFQEGEDLKVGGVKKAENCSGGDSLQFTSGAHIDIAFSYWDYFHCLYPRTYSSIMVVLRTEGTDSSNYISWAYKATTNPYQGGYMKASDNTLGFNGLTDDWRFILYGKTIPATCTVTTEEYIATDPGFARWGNINVTLDKSVLPKWAEQGYLMRTERVSDIMKVEYETSATGSFTGTWTEVENGGIIPDDTNLYIKFKITFENFLGTSWYDGITLLSIRCSYSTQTVADSLISAEIWEDRYWLATKNIIYGISFTIPGA